MSRSLSISTTCSAASSSLKEVKLRISLKNTVARCRFPPSFISPLKMASGLAERDKLKETFNKFHSKEIADAIRSFIDELVKDGHTVEPVHFDLLDYFNDHGALPEFDLALKVELI